MNYQEKDELAAIIGLTIEENIFNRDGSVDWEKVNELEEENV